MKLNKNAEQETKRRDGATHQNHLFSIYLVYFPHTQVHSVGPQYLRRVIVCIVLIGGIRFLTSKTGAHPISCQDATKLRP